MTTLRYAFIGLLGLAFLLPAAAAQYTPDQIHVSVAGTAADSAAQPPDVSQLVIHWSVAQPYGPNMMPRVKYSIDGGAEASAPATLVGVARDFSPPTARDEHDVLPIYAARIRAPLSANITYSVGEGSTFSPPASVKMLPKPTGNATVVALSHIGYRGYDRLGQRQPNVEAPAEATLRQALNQSPDVALFVGQLGYSSSSKPWNGFMRSTQSLQSNVITVAVPGDAETPDNHHQLRERYVLPYTRQVRAEVEGEEAEQLYHGLTIGPMYVIGLDSTQICVTSPGQPTVSPCSAGAPDQVQLNWLHDILEDAREDYGPAWIVIYLHHGPYMYADDGDHMPVRQLWAPLFETYNVDLVIHSNEAIYQRTHPLRNQIPLARSNLLPAGLGPVYVTPGTAGYTGPVEPITERYPDWIAKIGHEGFSLIRIDATNQTLRVSAIDSETGHEFDSFVLDKSITPSHLPRNNIPTTPPQRTTDAPGMLLLILALSLALIVRRNGRL